ncbi:MAG TPA: hypothetical protein VLT33_46510 [Labilithrix sp.]|nr:hypothetical protein [Labilithrix sp.]
MRVLTIAALLSSLTVFACGGGAHKEVKGPESDPWAGYTGKYAEPSSGSKAPKAEAKADAKPKADKAEKVAEKSDEPATPHKSAATIKGESVSSIDLDTFADASKSATKSKVVSTKYLVGPKYEQLQIQMKGVAVQVIRPAANPAPDGPSISSPKARSGEVSKTESGYYDADADVVVVVTAGGKAGAQKVLGTIVKH